MEFVIDYKSLSSVIKLRGNEISFSKDNNKLTVSDSNTQLGFAIGDISEFRFSKDEIEGDFITVKISDLQKIIKSGAFARDESEVSRQFITGSELRIKDGKMNVLSTDGKMMSRSFVSVENNEIDKICVLSPKCIEAIKTFEGENVNIKFNENMIVFNMEGCEFYMSLLNCNFPDTSKFFTTDEYSQYVFNKKEVLESFELLSVINDDVVNVECKEGKVKLSSNNIKGSVDDIFEAQKKCGEDFSFSVNKTLFSNIFKNIDADNIVIKYKGAVLPIEYFDNNGSDGVLMPLRKN